MQAFVCRRCQLLIPPTLPNFLEFNEQQTEQFEQKYCKLCHEVTDFKVQIPYVLVYLITELAVFGISVKLSDQ